MKDLPELLEKTVLTENNTNRNSVSKRLNYINWDEYFMSVAILSAKRSKDPHTQVGTCIVNDQKHIVGVGYNGMPSGLPDDEMPWEKHNENALDNKYLYVVHAELNAVLNKNTSDIRNCTLFTTLFPCNECTKVIIQSGIREIVFLADTKCGTSSNQASKIMLEKGGLKIRQFSTDLSGIQIQF